jgi:hypothetical protein
MSRPTGYKEYSALRANGIQVDVFLAGNISGDFYRADGRAKPIQGLRNQV